MRRKNIRSLLALVTVVYCCHVLLTGKVLANKIKVQVEHGVRTVAMFVKG
jgi:hypothetical protein